MIGVDSEVDRYGVVEGSNRIGDDIGKDRYWYVNACWAGQ